MNMQSDYKEVDSRLFGSGDENLLILGNGFDLDLGLKTKYSDFAKSKQWPFNKCYWRHSRLASFLKYHYKRDEWFDLENALAEFCQQKHKSSKKRDKIDKEDFTELRSSLQAYIGEINLAEINKESKAAQVLKQVCNTIIPSSIFSFNYTDLSAIAKNLGIDTIYSLRYMHGTVNNKNIILGVDDDCEINPSLGYMIKSRQDGYSSTLSFLKTLKSRTNIIFFGLSFNRIDYLYFREFFESIIHKDFSESRIWIITGDEESKQSILKNLNEQGAKTSDLYGHTNFNILMAKDSADNGKFQELLNAIELPTNR